MTCFTTRLCLSLVVLCAMGEFALAQESKENLSVQFKEAVQPFLAAHCVKCHGPQKQAGKIRLDDLKADASDAERWLAVRDQLREGLMPPEKEPRPDAAKLKAVMNWAATASQTFVAKLPNHGNLIPHELLFGKSASIGDVPAGRVWRLGPEGYLGFIREVTRGRTDGIVQPFTVTPERGIKDFAGLYTIDEPTTEILLRNAETIVETQTAHAFKDGKIQGKNDTVGEFVKMMDPKIPPDRKQLESAIQLQFRMALGRAPTKEESDRFLGLYNEVAKAGDSPAAVKTMLQAVLLRTDAMFRSEFGKPGESGRRMLSTEELVRAISLTLGDRRESGLIQAAQKGELRTKEQVAAHVRRILDDPKADGAKILRFFHQYFEYPKARDIFKEKSADRIRHSPHILISDTDRLIRHILAEDKDVFRALLTTRKSFVNFNTKEDKTTRKPVPVPFEVVPPNDRDWKGGVTQVYDFEKWPEQQPVEIPENKRLGILMQPSWLVAFGTNFENDPVRRGRWIRERLLGGTVPDLPIGVAAQVPDEPHRTFRDRLTVTRAASCWKCHQRMDDLGLPFENFSHFGRTRTTETVIDVEATAKNVDKKGKSLGAITREVPLDTTGFIADSGDPQLDGPVRDPRELVLKLANSDRVRQVFIRHVFRYFMGRNETLSDAFMLQEADRAYLASGGSFKTLLTSLLTSDPFLYRSEPVRSASQGASR